MDHQIPSATARRRFGIRTDEVATAGVLRLVVATLLCGAAGIHFAVTGEHFTEWTGYGVFFLVLAFFQLLVVFALRPGLDESFYFGVAFTQLAVIGIWIASRTTGLPVGPMPWRPESVGVPDIIASGFELVAVGLLLTIPWIRRSARMNLRPAAVLTIAVSIAVITITGWSLVADSHGSEGGMAPAASAASGH
jgi:glucose dehydrogenase